MPVVFFPNVGPIVRPVGVRDCELNRVVVHLEVTSDGDQVACQRESDSSAGDAPPNTHPRIVLHRTALVPSVQRVEHKLRAICDRDEGAVRHEIGGG